MQVTGQLHDQYVSSDFSVRFVNALSVRRRELYESQRKEKQSQHDYLTAFTPSPDHESGSLSKGFSTQEKQCTDSGERSLE